MLVRKAGTRKGGDVSGRCVPQVQSAPAQGLEHSVLNMISASWPALAGPRAEATGPASSCSFSFSAVSVSFEKAACHLRDAVLTCCVDASACSVHARPPAPGLSSPPARPPPLQAPVCWASMWLPPAART